MAFRAGFEPFTKKPIKYWFLNILGASLPTLLPTSLYCHGYDLRVPPTGIISTRSGLCYGLKKIGSLRFRFGGMFAHAPFCRANSLIQSASYPRSASNIVCGSKALLGAEQITSLSGEAKFCGEAQICDDKVYLGFIPVIVVSPSSCIAIKSVVSGGHYGR